MRSNNEIIIEEKKGSRDQGHCQKVLFGAVYLSWKLAVTTGDTPHPEAADLWNKIRSWLEHHPRPLSAQGKRVRIAEVVGEQLLYFASEAKWFLVSSTR